MDIGVPGGRELLDFSDALVGDDRKALDAARIALADSIGEEAIAGAAAVAANFTKNDRIANGCGIPTEPMVLKATKEIRAELNLNDFRSAINSSRHFPDDM